MNMIHRFYDSNMTHFRGYQDFAIEPHYEKLGEVNMQSEIARRQKLKQGNAPLLHDPC